MVPDDLAAALRGWTNIQNTDYNIEDYISTGGNRDNFNGAWQPRFGFSYDLFGDQEHVIFGGAGRAYDRNIFDYRSEEHTSELQSLMRISYAVFCLKKKNNNQTQLPTN